MSVKPLIGITSSYVKHNWYMEGVYVHHDYHKAVIKAGGIPIILPIAPPDVLDHYLNLCDGFILSGGEDIDPQFYKTSPHPKLATFYTERDESELYLANQLLKMNKPVLAICRGMQLMNVATGGTLIQDIPSQVKTAMQHVQTIDRPKEQHEVQIHKQTILHELFNTSTVRVNSLHHQALDTLSRDVRISATAPDGIIEAIEHTKHPFFLGVQWHPESMCQRSDSMNVLFNTLIDRAK
ncbi:gamma-glutamyl-gamma-aminobutyrate hydrolase [Priestia megaterium]|nr:gamma-glutamyl-gamma-aminobutyrate hydrolase [Priestia megaterium]